MNLNLTKLVSKLLRETADKIDSGNCTLSEEQLLDIADSLSHIQMSKEDACVYLNVSRATFDNLVAEGRLPKGKKLKGITNLVWYKDELNRCIRNKG